MTTYQLGFSDASLQALYQDVAATTADADMDQGARSVAYTATGSRVISTSGDLLIQSPELFSIIASRPRLAAAYQTFAGEAIPWELHSSVPTTQAVLQAFDAMVAQYRLQHPRETTPSEGLARAIFAWVTDPAGLNMAVDAQAPELSADQAVQQRRGDCSEFVKVLVPLLTRAGFSPYPVFVDRDVNGDEVQHLATALILGGQTFLLDPVYHSFNAAHQSQNPISLREVLAWHWNNRALDLESTAPTRAMAAYQRALQIDPENPHFLTNRGRLRAQTGDSTGARNDYLEAVRLAPRFHRALFRLGNLEFDAQHFVRAGRYYRQALALAPREMDYRFNLGMALASSGDRAGARRQLDELPVSYPHYQILQGRLGAIPRGP